MRASSCTFGIGLRDCHYVDALRESSAASPAHYEVITDNVLGRRGARIEALEALRGRRPIILHGLALDICGLDPLDAAYLRSLAELARSLAPTFVSDHLCWTRADGRASWDLLPCPFTRRTVEHVVRRVQQVQDALQSPLVLENISAYVRFRCDEMDEAEFVAQVLRLTGARLLLDVNNLYVNSKNHDTPAECLLDALSPSQIAGYHVAGHSQRKGFLFDTHDRPPCEEVLALLANAVARFGPRPVTLEWDQALPSYAELRSELASVESRICRPATPRASHDQHVTP